MDKQTSSKQCIPCEGISRAYTEEEALHHLKNLPQWSTGDHGKSIQRTYSLKNFIECINLINQIKNIAEDQNHHPDLHLTSYKNLQVVLFTHALSGVTENDFILATKINEVS